MDAANGSDHSANGVANGHDLNPVQEAPRKHAAPAPRKSKKEKSPKKEEAARPEPTDLVDANDIRFGNATMNLQDLVSILTDCYRRVEIATDKLAVARARACIEIGFLVNDESSENLDYARERLRTRQIKLGCALTNLWKWMSSVFEDGLYEDLVTAKIRRHTLRRIMQAWGSCLGYLEDYRCSQKNIESVSLVDIPSDEELTNIRLKLSTLLGVISYSLLKEGVRVRLD